MSYKSFKPVLTALAAALALSAAAPAQSLYPSRSPSDSVGQPLRAGQDCGLQYADRSIAGAMFIKAAPGQSGHYRLVIRRHNDDNDVLIRMSGYFDGSDTEETLIGRAFLASRNIMDIRRGEIVTQGRDVYLINGWLEIFDDSGALTCRSNQVDVLRPASAPFQQPQRPSPRQNFGFRF